MMDQLEREMAAAFETMKIRTRMRMQFPNGEFFDCTRSVRKDADTIIGDFRTAYGFELFDKDSPEYKHANNLLQWLQLSNSGCLESAKNILRHVCFEKNSRLYEEIAISEDQCMFVATDDGMIYYVERVKG